MAKHPDLDDREDDSAHTVLAAWMAVLDTLEAAVGAAEAAFQDPLGRRPAGPNGTANSSKNWLAPTLTTPLPPDARARAIAVAAKQVSVTRRLEEARLDTARQLQAVSSVPGIGEPPAAVYLDVKG